MEIAEHLWGKEVIIDFGYGHSRVGTLCREKSNQDEVVLISGMYTEFRIMKSLIFGIGLFSHQPPDYK
jgi:hypothetical protein